MKTRWSGKRLGLEPRLRPKRLRPERMAFVREDCRCNGLVTRPGHVIATVCQWSCDPDINLDSFFASNQTYDIFYPKSLHASLSASDLPRTDLDITFHTFALALSRGEVLCVLQNRGQAAYLIAGLREKTTYKSAPFWIRWWWSEGVPHALWKATGGATSEVVRRRLAGRGQAWLSGRQHQLLPGLPCVVEARLPCVVEARLPYVVETAEGLDVTLDDPAGLRRWILMDGWM